MVDSKRIDTDLASLTQDWMTQETQQISMDELMRETKRRTLTMRWVTVLEVVVSVFAVVFVANALSRTGAPDVYGWGLISLLAIGIASVLWTLMLRRDAWRPEAIGPSAVLALEIGRARTSQHIWRFNQGLSACTALGLIAMLAWTAFGDGRTFPTSVIWPWTAVMLPLFVASHVLMRQRIKSIIEQQRRLKALAAELDSN